MAEKGSKTLVDKIWLILKNNRFIAGFIVVGAIVVAIGQFTGALNDIMTFWERWDSTQKVTTPSKPNAQYREMSDRSPCAGNGGAAAIRAYAMAWSDPESLPKFVKENAMLFAKDGNTTKCLSLLTTHLRIGSISMDKALANFKKQFQDRKPPGVTGESWRDPSTEMWKLADYLQSLTTTLPLVAEGDTSDYYKSAIVTNAQKIWALMQTDPDLQTTMRALTEELNAQLMGELIAALPQEVN